MPPRHFLSLSDAGGDAVAAMLADAIDRKGARAEWPKGRPDGDAPLAGHVLGMIFEKASTRTRVSFDIAMRQLGGSSLILDSGTSQLGRGESIADTARVLSRMVDAIMIRTDDHAKAEELARHASVPVINGLTDRSHPCQIVADLLTLVERGKALPGLELAWMGDGNNVLHSILEAAGTFKFNVRVATPAGYEPDSEFVEMALAGGSTVTLTQDAAAAAAGADVIVTDTWVSM
ncbi:MAG: ornithine carbamoyltransferase, partial [Hyphomicrobiales bacterium]